ncbi:MAG TPA: hypothetical protein VD789_03960 [Thermomicrobiales bacterium]|nr:hypothetical protein [Thermomicrobiales bacterium]
MHRRRFLHAAAISTLATPLTTTTIAARQQEKPPADPSGLATRVAAVDPADLLEALLTTPVTTPLLPSDTMPIEPVPWDDPSDSDLTNALGAVAFNFGYDDNDNFLAIGNAMVHPDADSAAAFMSATGDPALPTFLGLPWATFAEEDYAISAVQVGYLILVGGAEPAPENMNAAASPVADQGAGSLTLRAISHMTALLAHLDQVLADLNA